MADIRCHNIIESGTRAIIDAFDLEGESVRYNNDKVVWKLYHFNSFYDYNNPAAVEKVNSSIWVKWTDVCIIWHQKIIGRDLLLCLATG